MKKGDPCPPHPVPDVKLALQRLRGFAFIGLTSEWRTSICLFHLKFGTPCRTTELQNVRPTSQAAKDRTGLGEIPIAKWEAAMKRSNNADKAVYAAARERFERDVAAYGATEVRCAQVCPPASLPVR